ncbi:hypothetical protein C8R45DRAFT_1188853 [Mycena sanguinolenta]|nr:hypothetical protein C8R45DRAFT_1188853 [Mycena sanguinolenta]
MVIQRQNGTLANAHFRQSCMTCDRPPLRVGAAPEGVYDPWVFILNPASAHRLQTHTLMSQGVLETIPTVVGPVENKMWKIGMAISKHKIAMKNSLAKAQSSDDYRHQLPLLRRLLHDLLLNPPASSAQCDTHGSAPARQSMDSASASAPIRRNSESREKGGEKGKEERAAIHSFKLGLQVVCPKRREIVVCSQLSGENDVQNQTSI